MSHPFAGGINYPWARPETAHLYKVLIWDVANAAKIDLLFKKAAPELPPLNTQQASRALWKEALEQIATAGALLTLCRLLLEEPGLPRVWEAAQAVLDAKSAVEKRISIDGRLTVNRATLRRQLTHLCLQDGAVKVLLVRGGPKTGKTWSRHLFERVAKDHGADVTYIFNGTVGSVVSVVDKLFSILQASDRIPPQDTSANAWYQQICNRLPEVAARRGRPLWIAVDDLGPGPDGITPLLDPEIRNFFDQFAMHLLDPAVHQWFRLMLIHYPDGAVPTKWERELWEEDRTDPDDLKDEDVAEVLREWAADNGKYLLDKEVLALAADVIARAAASLPPEQSGGEMMRLRGIHDELNSTLEVLGGQST